MAASTVVPLPQSHQNFEAGTILTYCAASGNLKVLQVLMKYNPNLPNIKCKDGLLPVHYAALYGKRDMLQYLLRIMSAEVDIYSGKDGTELLRRLIYGNLYDIALRLLKRHEVIGRDRMSYRKKLLEVMAEKPLAFKSGSRLGRLQRLIYNCIPVEKENISSIQITDNQIADRDIESLNVRSFGSIGKITSTFGLYVSYL